MVCCVPALEHALRDLAFDKEEEARTLERIAQRHPNPELVRLQAMNSRRIAAAARDIAAGMRF